MAGDGRVSDAHPGTLMSTPADLRSARRPRRACTREPASRNQPRRCRGLRGGRSGGWRHHERPTRGMYRVSSTTAPDGLRDGRSGGDGEGRCGASTAHSASRRLAQIRTAFARTVGTGGPATERSQTGGSLHRCPSTSVGYSYATRRARRLPSRSVPHETKSERTGAGEERLSHRNLSHPSDQRSRSRDRGFNVELMIRHLNA